MSIYDYKVRNRKGEDVSLVDKNGKVVKRYAPTIEPEKIKKEIKELLNA